VTPSQVRSYAAVAGIPATLVVAGHLALVWNDSSGIPAHQRLAFDHGIALAAVLAALLICSRIAMHLESGGGAPIADAVAVLGAVAVLAHLARVWRDGSDPLQRFGVTAEHIAALLAVAAATLLIGRFERAGRSGAASTEP
jgi:hypothetical protein